MKQFVLALMATGFFISAQAQNDSTKPKVDTIKIGDWTIIKEQGKGGEKRNRMVRNYSSNRKKISTNWIIVDLGFTNFNDNTVYSSAATQTFAPGYTADNMNLNTAKSVNVNIWLFMQRVNLVKKVVNLKWGLGLELNNYRFDDKRVKIDANPTRFTFNPAWNNLIKNKLAADYVTIPVMLNFDFAPQKRRSYGLSAGVSVGYLYSSRQKIKTAEGRKEKFYDDFDLHPWKISYIGELNLGILRLYGSYATRSIWKRGFDLTPYNVGIRFSNW
jgi:hypothetical protein